MRFAVLGAAGQLGRDLCPRLTGEVVPLSRADIDLNRPDVIPAAVAAIRADVFVNCAAYNFVDKAETDRDAAFAVNAWGVQALAQACRAAGTKLIHFSSDYVFGLEEDRETPFTEEDAAGPVSMYGLSKLTGEFLARSVAPDTLVIRTCGLYGAWGSGGKGGNFVETMLRLAGERKPIRVVNDQLCTPSYTVDIADATAALVRANATGLFHVTNAGSCTWYEFASELFRLSGLKPDLKPITSSEFARPARRPAYSALSLAKLVAHGIAAPRLWSDALADYLFERRKRTA